MPIRRHGRGFEVRVQYLGRRISRSFESFRDAQDYERRHRNRIADHRVGRTAQYSLEEAIERWLYGEAKLLKSHRHLENMVRVMLPHITGRKLSEIPEAAEAVKEAGIKDGLKPHTINRRLAILRRVGRIARRRWKWLDVDVSGEIEFLPGEDPRYVQATQEQAEKLLKAAKGRTREAIRWALLTGLRQGELRALTRANFHDGAIVITKNKTGRPRRVPLAPELDPDAFPYGLTNNEVARDFRESRARAGMPWLQFKDLRRTFGSWIVQKTRSLAYAQDLLGHSTPVITRKHYAHLIEGNLREAVDTLPSFAGTARRREKRKKAA
jgi:integrase